MILDVCNNSLLRIENITNYSFAQYKKVLNGSGEFEIQMPLGPEAINILQNGYIIIFERTVAGIITYFQSDINEQTANKVLTIRGKLLNALLSQRCIISTTIESGTRTQVVRDLVDKNCISATDTKRNISIQLSTDPTYNPAGDTEVIKTQFTGKTLQDCIESTLDPKEMGYDVVPVLGTTSINNFEFRVILGSDRTVGNTNGNAPVVFSGDLRNILQHKYTYNSNDYKSMAYVAGEGEGTARTIVEVGNTQSSGLSRYELYVDARDLSSEEEDSSQMTPAEYEQILISRGQSKLSENSTEESYSASINTLGAQYEYGTDYFLGDLVTIIDKNLDMTLNARVTEIQATSLGEKTLFDVSFGYYKMSTSKKLRRNGVI